MRRGRPPELGIDAPEGGQRLPGGWGRDDRFYAPGPDAPATGATPGACIAILAGIGPYGAAIARICTAHGRASHLVDEVALTAILGEGRAWAVIDATSPATAAAAKRDPGGTFRADIRAGASPGSASGPACRS